MRLLGNQANLARGALAALLAGLICGGAVATAAEPAKPEATQATDNRTAGKPLIANQDLTPMPIWSEAMMRTRMLTVVVTILAGCSSPPLSAENARMTEQLKKYPIPMAAVDAKRLIVQVAATPAELFSDTGWKAAEREQAAGEERSASSCLFAVVKDDKLVEVQIAVGASAESQVKKTQEDSFSYFRSSSRPSTWSSPIKDKLELPRATFAAYYRPWNSAPNTVFAYWANAQLVLVAHKGKKGEFASEDELSSLAKRLAMLFGSPKEAKGEAVNDAGKSVSLKVKERAEKSATITWSGGDKLKDYWIRIDAAAGVLSLDVKAPENVTITELPPEGAQVTAYAISPDSGKWFESKTAVPPYVSSAPKKDK